MCIRDRGTRARVGWSALRAPRALVGRALCRLRLRSAHGACLLHGRWKAAVDLPFARLVSPSPAPSLPRAGVQWPGISRPATPPP
eukprot:14947303-Alexandrium_andersonii.AAC.1